MYPVLFRIGRFPVPSYAIVVLAAMLVALALVPRSARRNGMDPEVMTRIYFIVVIAGIIGARLLHIALSIPRILENPAYARTILISGGVWYGGMFAGIGTAFYYARRHALSFAQVLDAAAVPVIVGGGLGRIACFLSGCCSGTPTSVPWAVTFTNPVAHRLHEDLPWVPIHPVQLYEMTGALLIAFVLDRVASPQRRAGTIALLWIGLYGVVRTLVEAFRGDAVRGVLFGVLSTSQIIGIASAAVALTLLARRRAAA